MPKSKQRKKKTGARRKGPVTSSKSSVGKTLVNAGAGLANSFLPGSGSLIRGLGKIMGLGAYTREGAESYLASKVPSMHSTIDTGIRIAHHEYLGEVSSSVAFNVISYPINPGLSSTFPWLSSIAGAFQKWEDHGIVFYFKSTSAVALNSTNTALGSVMGAVTYNPYQVAPPDKVTMLALSGVSTGKPAEDNLFPVECKMSQSLFGTKLIRSNMVTDDLAKYDAGNFHMSTFGSQAAAVIGELHVVYDITLKEPKLSPVGWSAHWYCTAYDNNQVVHAANTITESDPFSAVLTNPSATLFDLVLPANVGSASSKWLLRVSWLGTAAAIVYPTFGGVNYTLVALQGAASPWILGYEGVPATENVTRASFQACFTITNKRLPTTLRFTGGGATSLPTAGTAVQIFLIELDSSFQ